MVGQHGDALLKMYFLQVALHGCLSVHLYYKMAIPNVYMRRVCATTFLTVMTSLTKPTAQVNFPFHY